MIDPTIQLDPVFISALGGIAVSVLTQITKRFHSNPQQVFILMCIVISVIGIGLTALFGHDGLMSIVAVVGEIVTVAAGIWHLLMRPESQLQQFLNQQSNQDTNKKRIRKTKVK